MTPAQRLQVEQSEKRQKINELLALDELSDEQRSELDTLTKRAQEIEVELRAAIVAEPDGETRDAPVDAEMRERIELRSKASLGNFLIAAARGRLVDGAEAELCAAAWADGRPAGASGAAFPLELFDVPERRDEQRAVTDAPGTVGVNLDPIRPAVFANSIAPRLGIDMPRVGSGTYATATITTSQSAAALPKSGPAVATAGAFTVTTATPKRVSARLELTLEDIAAVGQANFESILRENLALALSDELDDQAINGAGANNDLTGIFQRLTDPAAAPTAVSDFDAFAAAHANGVDGLWANTIKDVGMVVGPATYRLASRVFQSASSYKGEMSAAAYAAENTGGFWTNKRMPDPAAFMGTDNVQAGILYRKGRAMMGGSGAMRTAVCPHWNVVDIDDIYSGSAKGERYFTAHVLLGDVILVQPDAYEQLAFRVA